MRKYFTLLESLLSGIADNRERIAIVWKDRRYTYEWLLQRIALWHDDLALRGVQPGAIVALEGDFSPNAVALLLALAKRAAITVPVSRALPVARKDVYSAVAGPEWVFRVDADDDVAAAWQPAAAPHALCEQLKERQHPGLIIFSSGTTGTPKAVLHDLSRLLAVPKAGREPAAMLSFYLFDHIGGIDTLLKTLANGWTVVTVQDRSPDAVCAAIERHRVEVLPVSPTFLNLMLLGRTYEDYDLSSLKTITYGTEPMPESTLARLHALFPEIKLRQTYGLSELGALKVRSKNSGSLWVRPEGAGVEFRVLDGILHTRSASSMLGYLNAPSPFTEDGWFDTGDAVEVDGEYLKILGRKSETINVGGQKVHPIEVESVIQELAHVASVTVFAEKNPIMGQILCARVSLSSQQNVKEFTQRLRQYCREKLQAYKVPVKIEFHEGGLQYSERFKKLRPARA